MSRLVPDYVWGILTVWQEARGESDEGKLAVATVIKNRMAHHYSSDGTVAGTVLKPFQFSGWNTNDPNRLSAARLDDTDPVVEACSRAWANATAGTGPVKDAVLYYNPAIVTTPPNWAKPEKLTAVIGAHHFYAG